MSTVQTEQLFGCDQGAPDPVIVDTLFILDDVAPINQNRRVVCGACAQPAMVHWMLAKTYTTCPRCKANGVEAAPLPGTRAALRRFMADGD
jgi:hypothetical protein